MVEKELYQLKFPIGEFKVPENISSDLLENWIEVIEEFPDAVLNLVSAISKQQKNYRYRPDGWTLKQVVHHCADSHMNAFIRFKLALTEDEPNIRPYFEDRWAELYDYQDNNLMDSINLLIGLHAKWGKLLRSLSEQELEKVYFHPEHGTKFKLNEVIANYAWHCEHHLEHVKLALSSKGIYQ